MPWKGRPDLISAADRRAGLLIARQRRDQVMGDQFIQRTVQIAPPDTAVGHSYYG